LASESGFDGFYMALLERKENSEQKEKRVQKEIE
jgi:16S rRNA (cytosine967-C5)-methyltransferase